MASVWGELKRRNVVKVAVAYASVGCLLVVSVTLAQVEQSPSPDTLVAPDGWTKDDLDRYLTLENEQAWIGEELQRSAVTSKAMIAGTSGPLAIHAGLEILKQGGNAADAALTTSLAQIALTAGATVSYAGIMNVVYYDADSAKVYTLNAAYNTVEEETEPLSIPAFGQHSGRTALVPGFMAGVQALHDRFGTLEFEKLFGPAIWIAESGVPFPGIVASWLNHVGHFVTRLPESERIFTKDNGDFYEAGELFRQPELAATLRRVAQDGAAYMYTGEWARRFAEAVQREGGKMTMRDLAAYRALWAEPAEVSYHDYQIVSLGPPSAGGQRTQWSFALAEVANLTRYEHYTESADSLYYLIQISREASNLGFSSREVTKDTAAIRWARIQNNMIDPPEAPTPASNHTAGVIVVDEEGNVACVIHTINGTLWGSTGIFVDGISIPDSASQQQRLVDRAGPGNRLPDTIDPLIVFKDDKPVLVSAAIGSAGHQATLQNVINILDFDMDPKTSVDTPNTLGPYLGNSVTGPGQPNYEQETIADGDFSQSVLDGVRDRGQQIRIVPNSDRSQTGYWIGIQIDPETRELNGAVTSKLPGMVEGY